MKTTGNILMAGLVVLQAVMCVMCALAGQPCPVMPATVLDDDDEKA